MPMPSFFSRKKEVQVVAEYQIPTHGGLEPLSDSIEAIHEICHRLNHA